MLHIAFKIRKISTNDRRAMHLNVAFHKKNFKILLYEQFKYHEKQIKNHEI